jgi:predicted DNA-binding transcriptional regulator AlpA
MMIDQLSPSARPAQAARILGIGESTFWRMTKLPGFPEPRRLSPRVTVFDVNELIGWRDAQGSTAKDGAK